MNATAVIAGMFLLLAFAGPASAQAGTAPDAVSEASALMEAGDYTAAISLLEGTQPQSPVVQFELAYAHFLRGTVGQPVGGVDDTDLELALRYAEVARDSGSVDALNLLHMIHKVEQSPLHDPAKAAGYLRAGADAGEPGAMLNLAYDLVYGSEALPRDPEAACPYILGLRDNEKAGPPASHLLGLVLMRGGCGLERDPARAVELFRAAANGGVTLAQRDLAAALEQGIGVERNEAEALDWYEKAAANGNGKSLWAVGMAYVEGRLRPRDPVVAVDYFRRAIDAGSADGLVSLAVMHASGDGVEQDLGEALALYERAAVAGHPHAYRGLAVMLALGQGTQVDLVEAHLRYRQALALGQPEESALRTAIEANMSPEDHRESDARYAEWEATR